MKLKEKKLGERRAMYVTDATSRARFSGVGRRGRREAREREEEEKEKYKKGEMRVGYIFVVEVTNRSSFFFQFWSFTSGYLSVYRSIC